MASTDVIPETESNQGAASKTDSSGPQNIAVEMEVDHEGNTVFVRGTVAPESSYHPIILVHAFGETGTLYREATRELNERGFSVLSFDMRGHGRSGRRMGYFDSFSTLVQDLLQIAAWLRHKSHGRSPIVIAQGASAAVGISFQLRYPKLCHRLVLVSPVLELKYGLSRPAIFLVRTIADLLPHSKLPTGLTPHLLEAIKFSGSDHIHKERPDQPHVYTSTYVREVIEMLENVPGRFLRLKGPTLIIRPEQDDVTDYKLLEELLKRHKRRQVIKEVVVDDRTHNLLTEDVNTLRGTADIIQAWLTQIDQEKNDQPH